MKTETTRYPVLHKPTPSLPSADDSFFEQQGQKEVRNLLRRRFDAVVMLTWSNWKKEPRSNRYHYALRFSRILPVIFVQPDSEDMTAWYEPTELPNVTVLHIPPTFEKPAARYRQQEVFSHALAMKGIHRPLLWIYNCYLASLVSSCYAPLKVYHATEDYLLDETIVFDDTFKNDLRSVFDQADLLVAVSEDLKDMYVTKGGYSGEAMAATNGCDYEFLTSVKAGELVPRQPGPPVALYQGGINYRLDFELVMEAALRLPAWQFWYCGQTKFPDCHVEFRRKWDDLLELPNVHYLGFLDPTEVRGLMYQATVGLIPFLRNGTLVDRSFPLKAFEYVACGLPVVTTPVKSLAAWPRLFSTARSANQFVQGIRDSLKTRDDPELIQERRQQAKAKSYEVQFDTVCTRLATVGRREDRSASYNILVVYDDREAGPAFDRWSAALRRNSDHQFIYVPAGCLQDYTPALAAFDALLLLTDFVPGPGPKTPDGDAAENRIRPQFLKCVLNFRGLKLMRTSATGADFERVHRLAKKWGVHFLFTQGAAQRMVPAHEADAAIKMLPAPEDFFRPGIDGNAQPPELAEAVAFCTELDRIFRTHLGRRKAFRPVFGLLGLYTEGQLKPVLWSRWNNVPPGPAPLLEGWRQLIHRDLYPSLLKAWRASLEQQWWNRSPFMRAVTRPISFGALVLRRLRGAIHRVFVNGWRGLPDPVRGALKKPTLPIRAALHKLLG